MHRTELHNNGGRAMPRIRVMLVDDHALIREGLRALLAKEQDIVIVAEAGDGVEALKLARETSPDVVIMDNGLPGMSGTEVTRMLATTNPAIKVLALTMHEDSDSVFAMLKAGAKGYILKQSAAQDIGSAIRSVYNGQSALDPSVARRVIDQVSRREAPQHPDDELTPRERSILQLVAEGRTSREIGKQLGLSARTVDNYRAHILEKLQARNRVEAITVALRRGWIQVSTPTTA